MMFHLSHASLHFLAMIALAPPTDTSGVSAAFINLAKLASAMVGGVIAFFSVMCGFQYIGAMDDTAKATHAKRAIGYLLIGSIIVAVGVTFAPQIVNAIFP